MNTQVWIGILLPFLGTSLGAAMVFVLKDQISDGVQRVLTGFAAGVMVAASFWSLLDPALESSESMGKLFFVPAASGFLIGIGFLLFLDTVTPHMHMDEQVEGPRSSLKRTTKLILAVTLHNIPEGMAVGVVYAGWVSGETGVSQAAALALALGIALQNFPEGAIVSMPLRAEGMPKAKTFRYGWGSIWRPRTCSHGRCWWSCSASCWSSSCRRPQSAGARGGWCHEAGIHLCSLR